MKVSRKTALTGLAALAAVSTFGLAVLSGRDGITPSRAQRPAPPPGRNVAAANQAATASLARQPLRFEINRGQSNRKVDFLSHGSGYSLFLRPTEAVFALAEQEKRRDLPPALLSGQGEKGPNLRAAVLRMEFIGADAGAKAVGAEELPGKVNYYIGKDSTKWHTQIPTYGRVKYRDLYPGVDLVYYGNQRQLEYDFVVAPKADPASIRIAFAGTKTVRLDRRGDLILELPKGEICWQKPVFYQEVDRKRRSVDGAYVLRNDHRIGFQVARYDTNRPLIIDPSLAYSTYLGGSGTDVGSAIAVDSSGDAYVTGSAISTNFPDAGAPSNDLNGNPTYDSFIAKYSPSGALLGAVYLGGGGSDYGNGIALAVKSDGVHPYIVGTTYPYYNPNTNRYEDDFPVTGGQPFNSQYNSNCPNYDRSDAFVAEFSSALGLQASVYEGGSRAEVGQGIAIDSAGYVYTTGFTNSYWGVDNPQTGYPGYTPPPDYNEGFPGTGPLSGAYQTDLADGPPYNIQNPYGDIFIARMDSSLNLTNATYIGGHGVDYGYGIATYTDALGKVWVYVTGYSNTAYPTTSNAYQTTGSGAFYAVMTKLSSSLSHTDGLNDLTCLGGTYQTYGYAIALDSAGAAYLTGYTYAGFPTTAGAFQTVMGAGNGGGSGGPGGPGSGGPGSPGSGGGGGGGGGGGSIDAFVSKIDPTQSGTASLVYSTYLGGIGNDYGYGIAVDGYGNACVTGSTSNAFPIPFPTTSNALHSANAGGADAFLTKLNATGSALIYSTLMGGSSDDAGYGIALDTSGNPYVTGGTYSTDFPVSFGASQSGSGGGEDAFVFKLNMTP